MRFALKVDDEHCWGCKACEVACKQEHRAPTGVKLIRVGETKPGGTDSKADSRFIVSLCRHCDEPPCAPACSARAITKRGDGIVFLDRTRCNGCGACARACPYGAVASDGPGEPPWKCNMCPDRLEKGLIPSCADNVCLAHCIYFGDARHIDRMIEEKSWLKHRLEGTLGSMVIRVGD
jgi:Fe-S-cluster-containing dehydrogenase component